MTNTAAAMDDLVDLRVEEGRWAKTELAALAAPAFEATLHYLGIDPTGYEIALLACDDATIADLNAEFRKKPTPTNVLSWPTHDLAASTSGEAPRLPPAPTAFEPELGDIAIAYETCVSEADAGNLPLSHHIQHLLVHSCLHLLGYDHQNDADAALMEKTESLVLATLGVEDPYKTRV